MRISKIMTGLVPVVLGGFLAAGASALPAAAVPLANPDCAPLATQVPHGYQVPIKGGLALDANGWGGGGTAARACTGAVANDEIVVYSTAHAGAAADWTPVALNTAQTEFSFVYTPHGQVALVNGSPLCVSTVTDVLRAFARTRACTDVTETVSTVTGQATLTATNAAPTAGNQWQAFTLPAAGDGFFQVEAFLEPAPGPLFLNDKGFSATGPVISYTSTTGENQIWETVAAP